MCSLVSLHNCPRPSHSSPSVTFTQYMQILTLWLPLLTVPFPSLELVGDVLQQSSELNRVLLEHISTEASQPWIGENQTQV